MSGSWSDWSQWDQERAEAFRLERLRSSHPDLLAPCFLYLERGEHLQVHIQHPEAVDVLLDNLDVVGWSAWVLLGARHLSLWFCQEQLVDCPTQEQTPMERLVWEALQSEKPLSDKEPFNMTRLAAPARPEAVATTVATPKTAPLDRQPPTSARVQYRSLAAVAIAAKTTPEAIETFCLDRGYTVLVDLEQNPAMFLSDATELVRDLMAETALEALQRPLQTTAQNALNGATTTTLAPPALPPRPTAPKVPATVAKKPASAVAPVASPERKERSRERTVTLPAEFRVQRSLAATVEAALALFADTPGRRKQIARAIGNETVDGSKYVKAILAHVPEAEQQKYEIKLIKQFQSYAKAATNR